MNPKSLIHAPSAHRPPTTDHLRPSSAPCLPASGSHLTPSTSRPLGFQPNLNLNPVPPRASRGSAFTLVEILVVISIIGLLAGLALPAVQGALNTARKGKARAEMQSIITALKSYQNEYGRLPDGSALSGNVEGDGDTWFGESASKNLCWMLSGDNYGQQNPRQIVFLELPATSTNGVFQDPWKRQYLVKLDTSGNNIVNYYKDRNGTAVIISLGKNGKQEDPDSSASDDVTSLK